MTAPRAENVNVSRIFRRQSLVANIIRACANCGAPGYWHDTPGVNVGCYAPDKVTKLGEDYVGTVCPNCGKARPPIEARGEIWSKTWKTSLWSAFKGAVADLVQPLRRRQ